MSELKMTLKTVTVLAVLALGVFADPSRAKGQGIDFFPNLVFVKLPSPSPEQSFFAPESWAQQMTIDYGWTDEHPRMLADINGDGKRDVVGFASHGVWRATSTGGSFIPALALEDFGYLSGWRVSKHVRTTGDVNGDRLDDVVGFGDAGVYRSLSNGAAFGAPAFVVAEFGYNQGWRVENHVRLLADINGDGRKDIVGFAHEGVWLSFAQAGGYFSKAVFALADFGYNQGWRVSNHVRTTADVNGDGRQDIVAFGDYGVWIALSTGTGLGPAQFVLADFGYHAGGWRVERHPRLLADLDRDGKQDIVAFGNDGVWTARSTGAGFAAPQFVIADFGYNQGWRADRHPRYVADLNGDAYPDIVGYGEEAVYRALGGPGWFGGIRAVLRDLVVAEGPQRFSSEYFARPDVFPRLVGDVNGDGMQDLVAFDAGAIRVARSSALPPQPPPAAPSWPRITAATTTTLSIKWSDNSIDERRFFIHYNSDAGPRTIRVGANTTTYVLSSLTPDKNYCFAVQAENLWGVSAQSIHACGRTEKQQVNKGPFTTSINMVRQQIVSGPVPYAGSFGPINTGAVISKINFPTQWPAVLLVRPGHSTAECGNPKAVVLVHGDMTADQKKAIWGTADITLSGVQQLNFVGCSTSAQLLNWLPVNITWSQP